MKKIIYKDYNFEITLREILVSISFLLIMIGIGYFICPNIDNSNRIKDYQTSAIVEDDKNEFDYLIKTKFGNTLAYSKFKAKNGVTFDEINGKYSFIKRVEEHYTMHSRRVCKTVGSGEDEHKICHTEYYWTWDVFDIDRKYEDKMIFMGYEFKGEKLLDQVINSDLKITKNNYKGEYRKINYNGKYVYKNSHTRYYYEYIPLTLNATIYVNLRNDKWTNDYELYINDKPKQVIEKVENQKDIGKILFVIIWSVMTVSIIAYYIYRDNDYLEDN